MVSSSALEAFEPAPTTIDLVEFARQAHEEAIEEHEKALKILARAMNSCPCAKGVERRKCTCKNFEKVAAEGGSILREAIYTCHCDVGRTFSKCDNVDHIQALDLQISSFEAVGKLDHAMNSAEWMLELAPRLPDGYLRLGNIARLLKKDEYAWKVYTAGIEANDETELDSSPKLQQLYIARRPLNPHFLRLDPFCLPAELVTRIFMLLDFTYLPVCLRVCKKWTRILRSPLYGTIWRDMMFPVRRSPHGSQVVRVASWTGKRDARKRDARKIPILRVPHVDELKRLLSWAGNGGARKIDIPRGMKFSQSALTLLLKESPSLEHLEILALKNLCLPSDTNMWTRLRHISIESYGETFYHTAVDLPGAFPQTFLQNAANSLEHLQFAGIPKQWSTGLGYNIPSLPKLKTLRFGDDEHRFDFDADIPLPVSPLSVAFPKLEQLWIGPFVPCLNPNPIRDTMWPHLKVLVFDPLTYQRFDIYDEGTRSMLRFMSGLKSIQYISLESTDGNYCPCIFSGSYDLIPDRKLEQYSEFQNLHAFHSRTMCVSPEGARTLLSDAIASEQLTSFSIVFPHIPDPDSDAQGYCTDSEGSSTDNEGPTFENEHTSFLRGYDWFRGTPSIHTLGCYGFNFLSSTRKAKPKPLQQFLASFPNLRTLSIDSGWYEDDEFTDMLVAILRATHLKTIYISSPCDMGHVGQVARVQGVEVVEGHPPLFGYGPQWPIPLKD